jgi:pyrimidine-nucleoside phosphorylase
MRAVDLIARKRAGVAHDDGEIDWLVGEFVAGRIPDYQMAAWLMAVCFQGLSRAETVRLTDVIVGSGRRLDLRDVAPVVADKHSTGGVGDKVTLALAPVVAACGLPFAKMSGRGLGHTGGTVDKLEAIPGFRTDLGVAAFRRVLREVGVVVTAQTAELAPADGLLYALRDATATVAQPSLIAASVMSKKIAAGANLIVLDVKVGQGAFVATVDEARELARMMVALGEAAGRAVWCVLTPMDDPLGSAVGNALEVAEAMAVLRGEGPPDVAAAVVGLAARLLVMAQMAPTLADATARAERTLVDGSAAAMCRRWIVAQGGEPGVVDGTGLPVAPVSVDVPSPADGIVQRVRALAVARACVGLGAGRDAKGQAVDPAVGVVLAVRRGDRVERGAPLARVHARSAETAARAVEEIEAAIVVGAGPPPVVPAILDEILPGSAAAR